MKEETTKKLLGEMDSLMRSLRQCDTQATAVDWMARAYNAMDGATRLIGNLERMLKEEAGKEKGLIFQIQKPKLEIVQTIPTSIAHRVIEEKRATYQRANETVVYPEFFLHPGLRPPARAWTRKDTLRLEAASNFSPRRIVKKGR